MFVLKESGSSHEPTGVQQVPAAKKQQSVLESTSQHYCRPPSFWNTLSRVRLTRSALTEFDRRLAQKEDVQTEYTHTVNVEYPQGRALQRLKRMARHGGPDLSHIRGVCSV